MDRLLKGIEDDEKSIMSPRSSGSSGSRTLVGVKSSARRSISAIRGVWSQVIDSLRIRLRVIENYIKEGHDYIPLVYYQDLLEFQRYLDNKTF